MEKETQMNPFLNIESTCITSSIRIYHLAWKTFQSYAKFRMVHLGNGKEYGEYGEQIVLLVL